MKLFEMFVVLHSVNDCVTYWAGKIKRCIEIPMQLFMCKNTITIK